MLFILAMLGGLLLMMGQQTRSESLFYYFPLEDQVPENHLLRLIDRHVSFEFVREKLKAPYSDTGRLAKLDQHHRSKASLRELKENALRDVNAHRFAPEAITTMRQFTKTVYLPHVEGQQRASTYSDYRNRWNLYLDIRCGDWWLREVRTCDIHALLLEIAQGH